jgi:hypothetical protein
VWRHLGHAADHIRWQLEFLPSHERAIVLVERHLHSIGLAETLKDASPLLLRLALEFGTDHQRHSLHSGPSHIGKEGVEPLRKLHPEQHIESRSQQHEVQKEPRDDLGGEWEAELHGMDKLQSTT